MEARRGTTIPIDIPANTRRENNFHEKSNSSDNFMISADRVDSSFNSPTLSRASNDFIHVMVNLHPSTSMHEFDDMSSTSSSPEPHRLSVSCPARHNLISSLSPKHGRKRPRHRVTFDEATITAAAELGESAARFRSRSREKHKLTNGQQLKFGSKNETFHHIDETVEESSLVPPNESNNGDINGKSIFDACNYSAYGRYT